jgi:hypothetical protein
LIFSLLGQSVRELVHAVQPAGFHAIRWDGTDARGNLFDRHLADDGQIFLSPCLQVWAFLIYFQLEEDVKSS